MLEEYNRRKKKHAWLETHIWHAKRFKMTECWGYKMAEQPCDKGFRAAYRASAQGCIMQVCINDRNISKHHFKHPNI